MKRRLLALMMVFAMLLSAAPTAFAASVWEDMAGEMAETTVDEAFDKALALLDERKADIYGEAYEFAADEGYIAAVQGALDAMDDALDAIDAAELEISDELKADLAAAIATLQGDIDAVGSLIAEANELGEFTDGIWGVADAFTDDLDALIALCEQAGIDGYEALVDAYETYAPCVKAICEKIYEAAYETISEVYTGVVEYIAALAEEYGPAAEAFVREWLIENPQAVMEAILAFGEDVDAFIAHWNYHVGLILGPAWNAYGDEITAAVEEAIDALLAALESETTAMTAEAAAQLVAYIESLNLDGQIEEIADALKDGSIAIADVALPELTAIVAELNKDIETKVDAVIDALEVLAASEEAAAAKEIIEKAIDDVLAKEEALMDEIAKIEGDIEAAYATIEEALEKFEAEIGGKTIGQVIEEVQAVIANPELIGNEFDFTATSKAVEKILDMACQAMEIAGQAAEKVAALTEDISIAGEEIDAVLTALYDELGIAAGEIETVLGAAGAEAEALLGETYAAIDAFVTTTVDTVITDAAALIAACELKVTTAVNEFVAAIENVLYKAVHGDLELTCVTSYYAIGKDHLADWAAKKEVTLDAELTADTDLVTVDFTAAGLSDFANGQIAGMITETIMADEVLVAWINDADVGEYIQAELAKYGIDLTAEVADLDWAKYLDETAIGVKDETLAGIRQVMIDHGLVEVYDLDIGAMLQPIIDEMLNNKPGVNVTLDIILEIPVADLAVALIDNLLYAYVSFAADFAAELNAIHATAPEAEVVVLGLTDAAEELIFKVANMEFDLGEYEDALATFANVHYYAYALLNGENTTFVAEKDADAILAALNVTVTGHKWGEWKANNDGKTHTRICTLDTEHTEIKDHVFGDDNICVDCGYTESTDIPADPDDDPGYTPKPSKDEDCDGGEDCPCNDFADLNSKQWYHEGIDYVLNEGLMNGVGDGQFAPNATTTRAMIITTLYRMEGSPAVKGEPTYTDVPADAWYTDAVIWGTEKGIIEGHEDNTYAPLDAVTREQIAAIFNRYAAYKKADTSKSADLAAYTDADEVSAWFVDNMKWAVGSKLINGRTSTTLVPKGATTRAEMATLLYRWATELSK